MAPEGGPQPAKGQRPEATASRVPEQEAGVGQAREPREECTIGAQDGDEAPHADRLGAVAGEERLGAGKMTRLEVQHAPVTLQEGKGRP